MTDTKLPSFARRLPVGQGGGIEIRIKAVPGASRSQIVGPLGDRLKVRLAAPPKGGKANRAVIDLLAAWLGDVQVELTAGLGHAEKTVIARNAVTLPPLP